MRRSNGNTEASSSGCDPRPIKAAMQVGSDAWRRACRGEGRSGTATGSAMRRCANVRAVGSKPRKGDVRSVQGFREPEDSSSVLSRWHMRTRHEAGSRSMARTKKMTQQPERPVRSVESRRPKARETKAWAECVAGVGGPHRS